MFRRKPKLPEFVRACTVYFSAVHETALVAALFNHGGMFAEQPDGIVVCPRDDVPGLGAAVRAALEACRYEPEFNYRDRKRSDWPAFKRSGCRSIRQFEQDYLPIILRGMNEANLICAAESPPYGPCDLRLLASVSFHAPAAELGACLTTVWQEYRRVSAA
jgi:hypothetical protein